MKKSLENQKPITFKKKKKRSKLGKILIVTFYSLTLFCLIAGFAGASFIYFHYSQDLPDVRELKNYHPSTITQIYSDGDEKVAEFYIEKRIMVPLEDIPLALKQATLAVEDSNFYYHLGIDPKAIFRAFITNMKAGRVVEGGSTITQQLSKTLFLSRERTLPRKIREAILSVRLELVFTKDEILEMYLNQIYYGHGSYGVEAAARTYFGRGVADITIAECAMIASLPKAPNHYSPYKDPKRARKRRNHTIRRMSYLSFITKSEGESALNEEFHLGEVTSMLNRAPYFVEHIRQFLEEKYGSSKLYRGGLKVYTTLDMDLQESAQKSVIKHLRIADKRYGYRGALDNWDLSRGELSIQEALIKMNRFKEGEGITAGKIIKGVVVSVNEKQVSVFLGPDEGTIDIRDMNWARPPNTRLDGRWARIKRPSEALHPGDLILVKPLRILEGSLGWALALEQEPDVEGSLVSLDPKTGQVKAMVGGYSFAKSQFNRAVQAIRQPGSAFKPIIYAAAVKEGFSPASIIIDSPIIFKEKEDAFDKWKPVNFEEKFYGPTSLRTALTHSRNVVTVKLMQNIGIKGTIKLAKSLGITSNMERNLSISLGSSGLTLFELTSAYSAFANNGTLIKPRSIRSIQNRKGEILYTAKPEITQPISPGVAYTITSLLQSVVEHGTGKKVKVLNRPVAGKTGTTNNFVDAWFMGYTPELVTGVWVGKDKDEPLGRNETGSRAAIPIWLQFMQEALANKPVTNFQMPSEIQYLKILPETGEITSFGEPGSQFEIFLQDHLPDNVQPFPESFPEDTFLN
ncbi:MAG: PBP1A family penicillin-binding protein [Nitrospina sp.]|jgi:penicillin-binding protein 1A|nr:PBP1A family penicillin-binding protein [Nitrospina sp.]MBT3414388.1 PBP1A family penicillin-binding protein [Nitrospina sp.]MBT3858142.1 PBP1A family penicillin-binding protein [Nitrospina sp.]MBT4389109.1 PBP1A family penicillin-binding protein [Nitrospina sp.]MBT4622094.1 PBP1A family penicillin-binding protein [Nitrospina sp.]